MRFPLDLSYIKNEEETLQWFDSIGAAWLNTEEGINSQEWIEIDFIVTPSFFKYLQNKELRVYKITNQGISFIISKFDLSPSKLPEFEEQPLALERFADRGILFCPMSNIGSINTFGRLQIRKVI